MRCGLRSADVLLDALALRLTEGYAAAAPVMTRGVELVLALTADAGVDVGNWLAAAGQMAAQELWDAESCRAVAARVAQAARDAGALVLWQFALIFLAVSYLLAGELATAAELIEEDRLIADATGNPPIAFTGMLLAAWRGREAQAAELIGATAAEATERGQGRLASLAGYAAAVLYNGLGRHDAARDAAWPAFEHDHLGYGAFLAPELAEAASRTGDVALVRAALEWLSERTRVTPGNWALGIEARIRALLSDGDVADSSYRESIDRLSRTGLRAELARSHLLYGEWLLRTRSLSWILYGQLADDAAAWHGHHDDASFLHGGTHLTALQQAAIRWSADPLTGIQRDFLQASERAATRRSRQRRSAVALLAVLALVASTGLAVVFQLSNTDVRRLHQAIYNQTAAEALQFGTRDTPLAAQLNLAAYRMQPRTADAVSRVISTENIPLATTLADSTAAVSAVPVGA